MMKEPSGVEMSMGVAVAYSEVMWLVDERCDMAVVIPRVVLACGGMGECLGRVLTCWGEAVQWRIAQG